MTFSYPWGRRERSDVAIGYAFLNDFTVNILL